MALQSLGIILIVLLLLLALGVPIAYSIGISALAVILRTYPWSPPHRESLWA